MTPKFADIWAWLTQSYPVNIGFDGHPFTVDPLRLGWFTLFAAFLTSTLSFAFWRMQSYR